MEECQNHSDILFKVMFEKDDCKALWRRNEDDMLEFLLIKADRSKICVIDISNEYTRRQLQSLLDSIRSSNFGGRTGQEEKSLVVHKLPEETSCNIQSSTGKTVATFHPIAMPWYNSCDKVLVRSRRKRGYSKHIGYKELFGEDPDYICQQCFRHFKQKGNLLRHEKTVHKPKFKFTCGVCGAIYKHRQHFEDHEKLHEGYMHQCEICLEGFYSRNTLRAHKRVCGTERPTKKKSYYERCYAKGPPYPKSRGALKIPFDFHVVI